MTKLNLNGGNEVMSRVLSGRDLFMKALFERPDSFAKILPYEEYLQKDGIYLLKDGSLGAVYEIDLVEHEPLKASDIVDVVDALKSWFFLPEKCTLQVLFDQSYIPARDKVWTQIKNSFPSSNPFSQAILDARIEMFKNACEGRTALSPMRRRTLLSIRYFPETRSFITMKNIAARNEKVLFDAMGEMSGEIAEFSQLLLQFLESSKVGLKRLSGEDLVDFLRAFFNPKEYLQRVFAPFNPDISISEQVVYSGPTGTLKGIEREGVKTRTITLKTSPRRVVPGLMANFLTKNFPFKISLNFSFPQRNKVKSYFDVKEFFLQSTPNAKSRRQLHELKEIQERLAHDERCLFMTFCVLIEGESEEILDERERAVISIFHNDLECEVIQEELVGLGLCLNTLPLFYSPASDYSAQRFIRILNKDAVKLLPVFDSFRGTGNPMQLFLSRENNLIQFSWIANQISNHSVFLGDTGSGKSKFALDCVQAMKLLSPERLAFVIDKRASCETLCRDFDGDLSIFDPKKGMPLSPFRGVFDDDKVQFLTKLILTGVKLTSASFEMESHHVSIVSRALKEAYLRRAREKGVTYKDGELIDSKSEGEIAVSMDDVVASMAALTSEEEFEGLKESIEDLIVRLMPFYGDGIYANFLKAPKKKKKALSLDKLLYAYDMEALDSDETLKVMMSMSIIYEIMTMMNKPENLARGGVLYIEELGCLGRDNPIVGDFIVEATERMRKMGFFVLGVAPNPAIFFELEAGRAIWRAADNFFFFKMSRDNVKYLREKSDVLDEGEAEVVSSLDTKDREYAEVFYKNKAGSIKGAFRYIQSSLDRRTSANSEREKAEMADLSE
ncbi:MAG TPA: TraC family protein [Bdellovibrio sp.]|uniref:TraC family protein n=1 Tax=Bdellovibrio sp. TaxID=28201 RepID=UPI002EF5399C